MKEMFHSYPHFIFITTVLRNPPQFFWQTLYLLVCLLVYLHGLLLIIGVCLIVISCFFVFSCARFLRLSINFLFTVTVTVTESSQRTQII